MRLTKEQAAIIGAYTGFLAGPFEDLHEYAERVMKRPVFSHEFASVRFSKELQGKAKADFIALAFDKAGEASDTPIADAAMVDVEFPPGQYVSIEVARRLERAARK